jgi:hypothetical protein
VVLAIAQKLNIPIRFIGVGEQSEDFGVFNAAEFVTALLKSDAQGRESTDGLAGDGAAAGRR